MTDRITWRPGALRVELDLSGAPAISFLGLADEPGWGAGAAALPLAEARVAAEGNGIASSERMMGSALSRRLRYLSHSETEGDGGHTLEVSMRDPETSLTVVTRLSTWADLAVVRCVTEVRNDGSGIAEVDLVSSFALGGLTEPGAAWWAENTVAYATNSWFREAVWQHRAPGDVGLDDVGLAQWQAPGSRASFALTGRGSWSSGGHLPMGMVSARDGSRSLVWQIENNGGWRWEVGDWGGALYVVASGPNEQAHAWNRTLQPGESFTGVPAAIAIGRGDDAAFAGLNEYRRRIRRFHEDNVRLPVVYNDFMNALMGDPTTEKLLPLIDAAAQAGAEYFCIDAGWHADDRAWWDAVGEWKEVAWRFPGGLAAVMDRIRERGMVPGLWMEPEYIGVNSPAADALPEDAYFRRAGVRVVEGDRYPIDFRHPAVVERMDGIVDRLVRDYGVGYLKFDYNVDVTLGTEVGSGSPGDGQLEHGRAYLRWVERLLDRHRGLVIENCGSGGQRMDYAMLAVHSIQSTSDNQDPILYAPIAAAAPTAVTPEQGAVWAYPDPAFSAERTAFTMMNSLLGRVHLGGRIDLLEPQQAALAAEAIDVYKSMRDELRTAVPFWPLGLPGWHDEQIALGLVSGARTRLAVWRRGGGTTIELPLPALRGREPVIECRYPTTLPTEWQWDAERGVLTVTLPDEPAARLLVLES